MNQNLECIYRSYEEFGSIFTANSPIPHFSDQIKGLGIKAIIDISQNQQLDSVCPQEFQVLSLPTDLTSSIQFKKSYEKGFQFIMKHRESANILVCSQQKYVSYLILFTYLMKRYNYSFSYIEKLYQAHINKIHFPLQLLQRLRKMLILSQKKVNQDLKAKLENSRIEKRLKRIGFEYSNISKYSHRFSNGEENNFNYQSVKPKSFLVIPAKNSLVFGDLSPILRKKQNRLLRKCTDIY